MFFVNRMEPVFVNSPFCVTVSMKRLPLLFLFVAFGVGCSDYPPVDPYISFNTDRSVDFPISNTLSLNQDIRIAAHGSNDTNDYIKNGSAAYLLRTSEVWRVSLQTSDPNFTLDQLSYARILIGSDTVAFDSIPQGTIDTSFVLTKADITPSMKDTSFTATLQCKLQSLPADPTTLTCGMTI